MNDLESAVQPEGDDPAAGGGTCILSDPQTSLTSEKSCGSEEGTRAKNQIKAKNQISCLVRADDVNPWIDQLSLNEKLHVAASDPTQKGDTVANSLTSDGRKVGGDDTLKPEDFELLKKLEEANRMIESDSKSLTFSSEGSCKSSLCHKKSASASSCTSSSSSSSSLSLTSLHRRRSLHSHPRKDSASSQLSEHKIGVPCSCSSFHSPEPGEDGEPLGDAWSSWKRIVDDWDEHKNKKLFLKELVRKGIPQHFRGFAWPLLSGAHDSTVKSEYKEYLRRSSKFEKFIRRDVSRTYPNHEMFKELDGPGQDSLFNIIKAYSLIDPEVGYCQGSAFVAGLLLMQMPEEDAFAVFVQVMRQYGLRELYKPSMSKIELCIYQLECMIQDKNPSLHEHFQAHGMFASTFATPWFLSLFATSLPLSLSCRVLDLFLSEGMDSIMALSYAMVDICNQELKDGDMEDMIKLLTKELPRRLERDPDLLFKTSYKVKFCQKKMKKLEKDFNLIKTKEHEDNVERKRLKTENKLLRQRIERLEEETSTLADRLIQDQVKYANQEEELYVLKRRVSLNLQSTKSTETCPDVISPDGNELSAKMLQTKIDELVEREVGHLAEMHDLKIRIAELEKKNLESHGSDVTDLQQQLVLSKMREAEMMTSAKELEQKVVELDKFWKRHQEYMNSGDNKPKVQKVKVQVLTEELLAAKLREANMAKMLMELKLKAVDLETKNHVNERLIRKLEEETEHLKGVVNDYELNKSKYETEIRGLKRQMSATESKHQNDDLMVKIKDAEMSQTVAELKQMIAQLEIQNQELMTAEELFNKDTNKSDNVVDIDARIEELHQQIVQLREVKKSKQNKKLKNGKSYLESLKRNYNNESDSDMDDFDAMRYRLKGNLSPLPRPIAGQKYFGSDLDLNRTSSSSPSKVPDSTGLMGARCSTTSVESSSISINVPDLTHQSSADSDCFGEDVLDARFAVDLHKNAERTSSNPDIVLDSVFDEPEPPSLSSDFQPRGHSSPLVPTDSPAKKPDVHQLQVEKFNLENDLRRSPPTLRVESLVDPDKTPTNEVGNDSSISDRFSFGRDSGYNDGSRASPGRTHKDPDDLAPKIPSNPFPDILSDPNTLSEIVKHNISSLIAGLDLPGNRCIPVEEKGTKEGKVISDRSCSLDILSRV